MSVSDASAIPLAGVIPTASGGGGGGGGIHTMTHAHGPTWKSVVASLRQREHDRFDREISIDRRGMLARAPSLSALYDASLRSATMKRMSGGINSFVCPTRPMVGSPVTPANKFSSHDENPLSKFPIEITTTTTAKDQIQVTPITAETTATSAAAPKSTLLAPLPGVRDITPPSSTLSQPRRRRSDSICGYPLRIPFLRRKIPLDTYVRVSLLPTGIGCLTEVLPDSSTTPVWKRTRKIKLPWPGEKDQNKIQTTNNKHEEHTTTTTTTAAETNTGFERINTKMAQSNSDTRVVVINDLASFSSVSPTGHTNLPPSGVSNLFHPVTASLAATIPPSPSSPLMPFLDERHETRSALNSPSLHGQHHPHHQRRITTELSLHDAESIFELQREGEIESNKESAVRFGGEEGGAPVTLTQPTTTTPTQRRVIIKQARQHYPRQQPNQMTTTQIQMSTLDQPTTTPHQTNTSYSPSSPPLAPACPSPSLVSPLTAASSTNSHPSSTVSLTPAPVSSVTAVGGVGGASEPSSVKHSPTSASGTPSKGTIQIIHHKRNISTNINRTLTNRLLHHRTRTESANNLPHVAETSTDPLTTSPPPPPPQPPSADQPPEPQPQGQLGPLLLLELICCQPERDSLIPCVDSDRLVASGTYDLGEIFDHAHSSHHDDMTHLHRIQLELIDVGALETAGTISFNVGFQMKKSNKKKKKFTTNPTANIATVTRPTPPHDHDDDDDDDSDSDSDDGDDVNDDLPFLSPPGLITVEVVSAEGFTDPFNPLDLSRLDWLLIFRMLIAVLIYLFVGVLFYCFEEGWSILDATYFCLVTATTTGFGDLYPTSRGSKVFTIFFLLVGIGMIATALGIAGGLMLERQEQAMYQKIIDEKEAREAMRDNGDKSDGIVGGVGKRTQPWLSVTSKRLITSLFQFLFVISTGSIGFYYLEEELTFLDSVYLCVATMSTVGYGDVYPRSVHGRAFCCPWIVVSGLVVTRVVGEVTDIYMGYARQKRAESVLKNTIHTVEDLAQLDSDNSGQVSELEFLKHMLVRTRACTLHEIEAISQQFRSLDADGSGFLDEDDFKRMAEEKAIRRQATAHRNAIH